MASAINGSNIGMLPKYFVVVLDDDLITHLDYKEDGVATMLGTWVEWISIEFQKLVDDRLKMLPQKCKKTVPFFYWVIAPTHSYFSRDRNQLHIKFNLSLESVIWSANNSNMRVIKLKDGWNSKDSNLVINNRMTSTGLTDYWLTVNAAF